MQTKYPPFANSLAIAAPIPFDAPNTNAVFIHLLLYNNEKYRQVILNALFLRAWYNHKHEKIY